MYYCRFIVSHLPCADILTKEKNLQDFGCFLGDHLCCCSLKHREALLGSNSMRNRIVQNDKHGQELLSTRLLFFSCLEFLSMPLLMVDSDFLNQCRDNLRTFPAFLSQLGGPVATKSTITPLVFVLHYPKPTTFASEIVNIKNNLSIRIRK